MKKIIFIATLLTSCTSQQKRIDTIVQNSDKNFAYLSGHIKAIEERVFAKEIEKGKAANCKTGFDIRTGDCLK